MAEQRSVLVVDDEAGVRDFFRFALEDKGCRVAEAAGGAEALERVKAAAFSVVFLDGYLNGDSGIEVLRGIRRLRPEQPVAVMSAMSDALLEDALSLGAWRCLPKPTDPREIERLVAEAEEEAT